MSTIYLHRPKAEKMIVFAGKKINRISLCCKTIEIQISSFAGFASIRQAPTELPRQAGEWRMLFEVLPSTLSVSGSHNFVCWICMTPTEFTTRQCNSPVPKAPIVMGAALQLDSALIRVRTVVNISHGFPGSEGAECTWWTHDPWLTIL